MSLHSNKECMRVPFTPHPCQHELLVVLLILTIKYFPLENPEELKEERMKESEGMVDTKKQQALNPHEKNSYELIETAVACPGSAQVCTRLWIPMYYLYGIPECSNE